MEIKSNEIEIDKKKIEEMSGALMEVLGKDGTEKGLIDQLVKKIPEEIVIGKSMRELKKLSLDIADTAISNKKYENLFRKFFEEQRTMPEHVKFVSRLVNMTQLIMEILFIRQLKIEGRGKVMERFGKELAPEIEAMEERLKYIG